MHWLFELHQTPPIAHAAGALAVVCLPAIALRRFARLPSPAFVSSTAGSDAPTVARATFHPLTALLRILSA